MDRIPAMTDMARSKSEKADVMAQRDEAPDYPYGLHICLTEVELDKLGLTDDVGVGDMLHCHCMCKVLSVSKNDHEALGPSCRVEMVITHMVGENEEDENDDTPAETRRAKLYG